MFEVPSDESKGGIGFITDYMIYVDHFKFSLMITPRYEFPAHVPKYDC